MSLPREPGLEIRADFGNPGFIALQETGLIQKQGIRALDAAQGRLGFD
ncbi:hypothetical protein [uncultured Sutterella sp.]|nr:hypothetical protein [uncultured Sutterella sp.]